MTDTWSGDLPFFSRDELKCKGSGKVLLDARFAATLPALRVVWGGPLLLTSCCRTPEHNAAVGGHPRSLHLTKNPHHPTKGTLAADLDWRAWPDDRKKEFARLAWSRGWSVGLHSVFIHVDRRTDIGLLQAVFLYGEWSGNFEPHEVIEHD